MPRQHAGRGVLGCADSISLSVDFPMVVVEVLAGGMNRHTWLRRHLVGQLVMG